MILLINYDDIEQKWQKAWADARIFEGDINQKNPYMVTVAWPYVNGPQHIGHMRTFGTADVLARYRRMCGYNVLFPMGFHATGTPILAFAKRIKNNDRDLIADLEVFHIPKEDIGKMTDPVYIANYFSNEIERGMHRAGYSIDWRRKFTSTDPFFSKFVEWQFSMLNKKGYLVKGKHPVGWCPNENQAVGMHDTKKDVQPDIERQIAVKFKLEAEDSYILCATYRPETLSGVTNLFISNGSKYSLCKIDGQEGTYYISKSAVAPMKFQMGITEIKEVEAAELMSKKCTNPVTGTMLRIFPGSFVKEDVGTGAVMSVPAHAPFDYSELQKLKAQGLALDVVPVKVLDLPAKEGQQGAAVDAESYVDLPALAYIRMFEGTMAETEALEAATKLSYKEEFHSGKMSAKGYEGMSIPDARKKISDELLSGSKALEVYSLANAPVTCRCGQRVVVNLVEQWFLNYGNKEWKDLARNAFSEVAVLPEKTRNAFDAAIEWIDLRAVARAQGLGTRFPLDPNYIIESLSDSTIYMAFYTISHFLKGIDVEKLKPELFDYIFLGSGKPEDVEQSTGVDYQLVKKCRDSFDYWYRMTSRHSGPDLIFNHLTMYVFNHATIFAKEYWPKPIVVNGSVLSEGEKMSKSLGNIVPLVDAFSKYGADVVRTMVLGGADLFSDSEFSEDAAKGVDDRFSYIYDLASKLASMDTCELRHMDYWLYSRLNKKIKDASARMEKLELRGVSTAVIYDSVLELRKYLSRGTPNGIVMKDFLTGITLMLSPIAPHVGEEIWHLLGNNSLVSTERWPSADDSLISEDVEREEDMLEGVISDTKQVMALMRKNGKEPKHITLIVASDWKRTLSEKLAKTRNMGQVMSELSSDSANLKALEAQGLGSGGMEAVAKYLKQISKKPVTVAGIGSGQADEFKLLEESAGYLSSSLGCTVSVEEEAKSKSQRAPNAVPQRPSIDLSV